MADQNQPPDLDETGQPVTQAAGKPPDLDASGAPVAQTSEPSFLDRMGGWRGVGATGLRVLGGVLATPADLTPGGMAIGAGVSGLGESAAEALEGSPQSPARIGAAAALGAVPFGTIYKEGRPIASALRGALYGGAGAGITEAAQGQPLDPAAIGTSAVLGGAMTGALAKFFGKAAPAVGEDAPLATQLTTSGGRALRTPGASETTFSPTGKFVQRAEPLVPGAFGRPFEITPTAQVGTMPATDVRNIADLFSPKPDVPLSQPTTPFGMDPRVPNPIADEAASARQAAQQARQEAQLRAQKSGLNQDFIAATTAKDEQAAARRAVLAKRAGLTEGPTVVSETQSAPGRGPGQTITARRSWTEADEDAAEATGGAAPIRPTDPASQVPLEATHTPAPEDVSRPVPETQAPVTPEPAADPVTPNEPAVETAPAQQIPTTEDTQSPLGQMFLRKNGMPFMSRVGAAGANLRDAQSAVTRGEIPAADEAYQALVRERSALGKQTGPLSTSAMSDYTPAVPASPTFADVPATEIPADMPGDAYQPSTTPGAARPMTPDEVTAEMRVVEKARNDPNFLATLKQAALDERSGGGSESGQINPKLMRALMGGVVGGTVGAPVGALTDPDDPLVGTLRGGTLGALLGAATFPSGEGDTLGENLINYRNASLLANPVTQAKKFLGDQGGIAFEGVKRLLTPGEAQTGANIFKEQARLPTNAKNFYEGLKPNADIGTAIGDTTRAGDESPLGIISRPFNANLYMAQEILKRAGVTDPETIQRIVGNKIDTPLGNAWYGLQKYPLVQTLRPFAKIGTAMAEGVRNLPGVGMVAGNAADRLQRQAVGGLQMGLGGLSELYDESNDAQGDPSSTASQALRAAAIGPQGVMPYAVGKALTAAISGGSAKAISELIRLIPGAEGALLTPYPNEGGAEYLKRLLGNPIAQVAPSFLLPSKPDSGSAR